MKYLFILGRNHELSVAEIEEFLKKEENPIAEQTLIDNGLLVTVDKPILYSTIDKLGGTISIGEVLASGEDESIFEELEKIMIYKGEENKLTYTVWDFSNLYDDCLDYLKSRFKSEKIKTSFKGLSGTIQSQEGEKELRPSSKLIQEEYFIFQEEEKQYFGKITQKCDYDSIEKRDMEKPERRESLAISPRLAKILINLANLKKGETLFDPFCGIGVMLQEAMIQGISAVGCDIDKKAIHGAKRNFEWFNFNEEDYTLINFDSKRVNLPEFDAIATEPDLGEVLKKIPTKEKAEKTLKIFEKLMVQVINNSKKQNKGRVVFTSPYIRIGKKRLSCDILSICEKTGYKLARESIAEYRGNQIVGRMIYILEKSLE